MEKNKPVMDYPSVDEPDGNVFVIMGKVRQTLKFHGLHEQVQPMIDRVTSSGSYEEAIQIMQEYVEPL